MRECWLSQIKMFPEIETLDQARARNIEDALREDVGTGSLTEALIKEQRIKAKIICRQRAILCGMNWCIDTFKRVNSKLEITFCKVDGDLIKKDEPVCLIEGDAKAILKAERVALNFLQLLSSTATTTRRFVDEISMAQSGKNACTVLDTRKTQPGLRLAQKYAVRIGGGKNQRLGLWDGFLFKENHLKCLGGISELKNKLEILKKANKKNSFTSGNIQIEVENISELKIALSMGITNILLDNFSESSIIEAVRLNRKQAVLEVSGGVNFDSLVKFAKRGVDRISIGCLTKDVIAIDFSLQVEKNYNS